MNQFDYVAIDGRHASSVMDERMFRSANMDSNLCPIAAKVRSRISAAKFGRNNKQENARRLEAAYATDSPCLLYEASLTAPLQNPSPRRHPLSNAQWKHTQDYIAKASEKRNWLSKATTKEPMLR